MGFLYKEKCYATLPDANTAFFNQQPYSATPSGSSLIVSRFVNNAGVWYLQKSTYNNAGNLTATVNNVAPVMSYPACNENSPDYYLDGVNVPDALLSLSLLFAFFIGFRMVQ